MQVQSRPLGRNVTEMIKHFCSLVWSMKKGKLLTAVWGAGLFTCFLAAFSKYKEQQRSKKLRQSSPDESKQRRSHYNESLITLLKPILKISFPSLLSDTTGHLLGYTVLLCARILLTIKIAKITGNLGKVRVIGW